MAIKQLIKDNNLTTEWRSWFSEQVLLKVESINHFLYGKGLSKKDGLDLVKFLIRTSTDFASFYNRDEQYRLSRFSQTTIDKTVNATRESLSSRIATNLAKYGSTSPFGSEAVRAKAKATFESNGYLNPFNNKDIHDKALDKAFRNPQVQQSLKQRFVNKYGIVSPMHSQSFKEKCLEESSKAMKEIYLNKYGFSQDSFIEALLEENSLEFVPPRPGFVNSEFQAKCTLCGNVSDFHVYSQGNSVIPYRVTSCPFCGGNRTVLERALFTHLYELFPDTVSSYRPTFLHGQEIDIFIPSKNIGFEINGALSHNSAISKEGHPLQGFTPKPADYHASKSSLALDAGINLYHIWEHWPRALINAIVDTKIWVYGTTRQARKLTCTEISFKEANDFLRINHTQGFARFSKACGLFAQDMLVSMLSIIPKRKGVIEVVRNCTIKNVSITGGFTRLFSKAILWAKSHDFSQIITYADRDLTPDPLSSVYARHGFQYLGDSGPTLSYYIQGIKGIRYRDINLHKDIVYNRFIFQKHKLPNLFKRLGVECALQLTEQQLLFKLGIHPLYNSGCHKYTLFI